MGTFAAVRACAEVILDGAVLQADGVSAGNGRVVDWRTVKNGETLQDGCDAFDTAQLFVALVGCEAALSVMDDAASAPPSVASLPEIVAFMANEHGARRRSFTVGRFTVVVEPHSDDDSAQAAFARRLAEFAEVAE